MKSYKIENETFEKKPYDKFTAHDLLSLTLKDRQLCDLELLLNDGFHPLNGFMNKGDYDRVLNEMRLTSGQLWPMPITLDVSGDFINQITKGQEIALRDPEGLLLAILTVNDIWLPDKLKEAALVFGTQDIYHPGVSYLMNKTEPFYIGGKLTCVSLPHHYDFTHLRYTPAELKNLFSTQKIKKIVAFQTRNPMHRAHQELTFRAAEMTGAKLLLHPVVGMTKPGDVDYYLRVRCYEHILETYPKGNAILSLLPLAMRMGGPREALWHALIRKNYGATHFIVGRDHAGPGKDAKGIAFYDPYAAQKLVAQYQDEIGIEMIPFQEMLYSHENKCYFPADQFPKDETPASISGTEFRERLRQNKEIPEWFSYPKVIEELRDAYPAKHLQGFTVFFTGLPSSGKSTLAQALAIKLRELTKRKISLLDGDVIRTNLSKGLGFEKTDREINVSRVGYVASEITKHGGIALCALVSPYKETRDKVRGMIEASGGFIEVYVNTALDVCEKRDRKGLYRKARDGLVKQFTGISDPYEEPVNPEVIVDTVHLSPLEIIDEIISKLKMLGYIK